MNTTENTKHDIYMVSGFHNARVEATDLRTMVTEVFYGYTADEIVKIMLDKRGN